MPSRLALARLAGEIIERLARKARGRVGDLSSRPVTCSHRAGRRSARHSEAGAEGRRPDARRAAGLISAAAVRALWPAHAEKHASSNAGDGRIRSTEISSQAIIKNMRFWHVAWSISAIA